MQNKVALAVLLVVTMAVATTPLPARACLLAQRPLARACPKGCCAKKACCAEARKTAVPSKQPLATNAAGHELVVSLTPPAVAFVYPCAARERIFIPATKPSGNSQPKRAFLCTFLI